MGCSRNRLSWCFLHADMDDLVVMVLRGELAELMAAVAPEIYRRYITYGKDGMDILMLPFKIWLSKNKPIQELIF